jgi:hypothetical protein
VVWGQGELRRRAQDGAYGGRAAHRMGVDQIG